MLKALNSYSAPCVWKGGAPGTPGHAAQEGCGTFQSLRAQSSLQSEALRSGQGSYSPVLCGRGLSTLWHCPQGNRVQRGPGSLLPQLLSGLAVPGAGTGKGQFPDLGGHERPNCQSFWPPALPSPAPQGPADQPGSPSPAPALAGPELRAPAEQAATHGPWAPAACECPRPPVLTVIL